MVDVSLQFDILNAVVNITIALVLTIWWKEHLRLKRERAERWEVSQDRWKSDVEPHMIRLDRLVTHGVTYKDPVADRKKIMQNCFAACRGPSGQPDDEDVWRSKLVVNQYWEDVVFQLTDKPPRGLMTWGNSRGGKELVEEQRTWFLKRAAYFVSVVEPLNYVWHYKQNKEIRDFRHQGIHALFKNLQPEIGLPFEEELSDSYKAFESVYIDVSKTKYDLKVSDSQPTILLDVRSYIPHKLAVKRSLSIPNSELIAYITQEPPSQDY
jgi:hypothetical protein